MELGEAVREEDHGIGVDGTAVGGACCCWHGRRLVWLLLLLLVWLGQDDALDFAALATALDALVGVVVH